MVYAKCHFGLDPYDIITMTFTPGSSSCNRTIFILLYPPIMSPVLSVSSFFLLFFVYMPSLGPFHGHLFDIVSFETLKGIRLSSMCNSHVTLFLIWFFHVHVWDLSFPLDGAHLYWIITYIIFHICAVNWDKELLIL